MFWKCGNMCESNSTKTRRGHRTSLLQTHIMQLCSHRAVSLFILLVAAVEGARILVRESALDMLLFTHHHYRIPIAQLRRGKSTLHSWECVRRSLIQTLHRDDISWLQSQTSAQNPTEFQGKKASQDRSYR